MSDSNFVEPEVVIELVETYVRRELHDAERYENSTPLDDSGIWSLHQLARDIYALGVQDGCCQESRRASAEASRRRERERKAEGGEQG